MAFVNNRTTLNQGDNANNVASSDNGPSVETASALYYQGNSSISAQFTNAQEYITYDQTDADVTFSLDLSDQTVWVLYKDNLIESQVNGGAQVVIGNGSAGGSALIGYYIGGTDNPGLSLNKQFNVARLDVSNRGSFSTNAHNGTVGGLDTTTISNVGFGSVHALSARGNVDNVWVDAVYYHPNNAYHCRFSGTTLNTFSDAVIADQTNGWGLISTVGDEVFTLFGSLEFGDGGTDDVTVSESGKTLILDGRGIGANNFLIRTRLPSSTGIMSITYSNMAFVNLGTGAIMNFTAAIDTLSLTDVSFSGTSVLNFPFTFSSTRTLTNVSFSRCGSVNFGATGATGCSFSQSIASGAMLVDSNSDTSRQSNISFTRGTTGSYAIQISNPGTYSLDNFNFSGYAPEGNIPNGTEVINNSSGGAVILNVTGGSGEISVHNTVGGGSVTVNQTFTITVTGILGNSEVRVYDNPSRFSGGSTATESTTPAGVETVAAVTQANTGSNYIFYLNDLNLNVTQIQRQGAGVDFTTIGLVSGDKIRVVARDNADNSTLQLFDEFEVNGTVTSTVIPIVDVAASSTLFSSILDSLNAKTVTIEKVNASVSFTATSGTYDVFIYRIGSLPIIAKGISVNSTDGNASIPISQAGDRVYNNPA